ncbi:unnamed protein product [Timema podura]|uniref:Uncharacterized protein n=1 Tax=Timema podura TaxID=61482 RepID=A0ABN7NLQ4_TIMPD|nr:unnamed protein product [Timema podura]
MDNPVRNTVQTLFHNYIINPPCWSFAEGWVILDTPTLLQLTRYKLCRRAPSTNKSVIPQYPNPSP